MSCFREKKCSHQQPKNRSTEKLLPGPPVRFATHTQLQKNLLIRNAYWIKIKIVSLSFFLLHLLATTEQNHQDHEFEEDTRDKRIIQKKGRWGNFSASVCSPCPRPADSGSDCHLQLGLSQRLHTISCTRYIVLKGNNMRTISTVSVYIYFSTEHPI